MWIGDYAAEVAKMLNVVELWPDTNRAFRRNWPAKQMTPEEVRDAWLHWPTMNIGVVSWPRWWVLDLDGEVGVSWFRTLAASVGSVTDIERMTLTILTPGRSGGRHLWFQVPSLGPHEQLRSNLKGCREAEVKYGKGRQTAFPPSRRPEGVYRFADNGVKEPAPTPDWLLPWLLRETSGDDAALTGLGALAASGGYWGYLAGLAIQGTVENVVGGFPHWEGERNDYLYWAACVLRDIEAGEDAFAALAREASIAGLGLDEIEATMLSARGR